MRREIVGRAADRGRNQDAVGDQLIDADDAVDRDPQLCRLAAFAQQRHLIEGERAVTGTLLVARGHFERMQHHRLRFGEAFEKPVGPIEVHQKADAAAMHAVDRHTPTQKAMQGFEHEAVASERDDDIGVLGHHTGIAGAQLRHRLLRYFGLGRDDGDPGVGARRRGCAHPPVTLIWRATAGRLWRRSMMKSWPFGLRPIASPIAATSASSPSDWRKGVRKSAASSWPRHI